MRTCSARRGVTIGQSHSSMIVRLNSPLSGDWPKRIATSTSSRSKSMRRREAEKRSSMSGLAAAKVKRRGASHLAVKPGPAVTVSGAPSCVRRAARHAAPSRSNPSVAPGDSARPASVNATARFMRRKSGAPKCSSSERIWNDRAAGVTPISAAALAKERCRAAASKARRAVRGGRRSDMDRTSRT